MRARECVAGVLSLCPPPPALEASPHCHIAWHPLTRFLLTLGDCLFNRFSVCSSTVLVTIPLSTPPAHMPCRQSRTPLTQGPESVPPSLISLREPGKGRAARSHQS